MRRNMLRYACLALLAAALLLLSTPGAAAYDLLLLRQDWAPNAPFDPSCANNGCANKLDYGAFTVRDLAPSMTSTLGLAVCSGPSFDAAAIPADVRSALGCVLSEVESVWEAVWNNQGRCSGLNITAYFTFLAASFNLFSANTALAANTAVQLPAVDRDALTAALREAWGVQPWVSCDSASKSLLWVSLCLSPSAAAAGVVLPVDCPWDPAANVAGGVECSGQLTLTRGQAPPPTCSPYYPATLDGSFVPLESGGGSSDAAGTGPVASVVDGTLAGPSGDAALAGPSGGGASGGSDGGSAAGSSAEAVPEQAADGGEAQEAARAPKPELAPLPASWDGLAELPPELNPGAAAVSTGADFLRAMAEGLGDITLAGDIALAPGDFHFQEYSLPLNVSGAVWVHAADPSTPAILDWSNVSGLVNVYEDSTLVLEGVISQNVGDGAKAIAARTVRVEVKGSPLWPTVTGANGHRVLILDSYLVVPQPVLFEECLEVLQNSSWPFSAGDGGVAPGGGDGVFHDNLTVITSSLALVDVEQLPDLGVGSDSSYSPGQALYSLVRTSAAASTPATPAPPPAAAASSSGSGLSAGAIAGIAAGAAVAAIASAAACVVWRRRRGRAQQVAAAPKGALPSPRLSPKSHSLDSKDGGTGGTDGTACDTVVIHLDSDDASSQAAATASADSAVLAAGGLAPLVGGRGAKAGGGSALAGGIARQRSDVSGSTPGTAHSVLPGGRDNPFNSTGTLEAPGGSTGDPEGDDLFLSYIRTRQHGGSSPGSGASPAQTPPFSRQSSLAAGPGRRAALSSQESALWAIPFEQLELEEKIGEGAFGRVYRAEWHATPVAVKVLLAQAQLQDTGSLAEALAQPSPVLTRLQEEADLMFSLRHPNCVQLMGTCLAPPCLVTEYCSRGSLADCLRAARRSSKAAALLSWRRRLAMALDAAKGMLYLHSYQPPIVHRDLKSPNLLVDKDWNVKVADFNLSKILGEDASASQEVTNPRWLAPEVLQGEAAGPPSDVFSFGVVMWELLTFHLPWCHDQLAESANPWQLARMVLAGARLPVPPPELLPGDALPPSLLAAYTALMQGCWVEAPGERPTFAGIAAALRDMLQQLESGAHN